MNANNSTPRRASIIRNLVLAVLLLPMFASCGTWPHLDLSSQLTGPMIQQVEDIAGAVVQARLNPSAGLSVPPIDIHGGVLLPQTVPGSALSDGAVGSQQLAKDSVTTDKIKDGEVMHADLANDPLSLGKMTGSLMSLNGCDVVLAGTPSCPTSNLRINGLIHSTNGGFMFSNGDKFSSFAEIATGVSQLITNLPPSALGDNSVTSSKILNGHVMTDDLANGAVTSAKIANGSITAEDLSAGVLAGIQGPPGPEGPTGPQGDPGPQGPPSASPFALDASSNAIFNGGNVGIGTGVIPPGSALTVNGVIDSLNGGALRVFNSIGDVAVRCTGNAGGSNGGAIGIRRAGDLPGISLQAYSENGAEFHLNSLSGAQTFTLNGGGTNEGSVLRMNSGQTSNQETIRLEGWHAGNPQLGGRVSVWRDGTRRAEMRAFGSGNTPASAVRLYDDQQTDAVQGLRVNIQGSVDATCTGCVDYGGEIQLLSASGTSGAYMKGGVTARGGELFLNNRNGTSRIRLIGDDGTPGGDKGRIELDGDLCINGLGRAVNGFATGACSADIAETFDLTGREMIEPGMVLTLDGQRSGHLTLSKHSYDTKVAGIVSGAGGLNPGVRLGQRGDGNEDLPIALSGRVYCFVDAAHEAVAVGDMLTTSDTPGHAMKASDRNRAFGAVLGKAMEPLAKGKKSLVLVLVSLQ